MTPQGIAGRVLADRLAIVDRHLAEIRDLPLRDRAAFFADGRNTAAAESFLRRSLEALFDVGRHILARAFGEGVGEYKEIAKKLGQRAVLKEHEAALLTVLAGYRNRLAHFYHEISRDELLEICSQKLGDLETVRDAFRRWIGENPDKIDRNL
jgi:uncharacterized protein YutE (UPF0331/DUF86 family)